MPEFNPDTETVIEIAELEALRAERDSWRDAHAERSAKVVELQAENDALHNELVRVKRVANCNLGNAWDEQQRGNQYRRRALALHRKIRRDTAVEKQWEETYEAMLGRVHEHIVQTGVKIKKVDGHGREYYESFHGRIEDLGKRWEELAAERDRLAALLRQAGQSLLHGSFCKVWDSKAGDVKPCNCGCDKLKAQIDAALAPAIGQEVGENNNA